MQEPRLGGTLFVSPCIFHSFSLHYMHGEDQVRRLGFLVALKI